MKQLIETTPARVASLRAQLDDRTVPASVHGLLVFKGPRSAQVVSYDAETNLGVLELPNTGLLRAFSILDDAKPVAKRDFQPESFVEVFEIDTVAEDGGAQAAIGSSLGRFWRIVKRAR